MALKHAETRVWPNGTVQILMHNPDIGAAVTGLEPPEAIHERVAAGIEAGGKEGLEIVADVLLAGEAYAAKLSRQHADLAKKIDDNLVEAQAVGGAAFATLRARSDAQASRIAELESEVNDHLDTIAVRDAQLDEHKAEIAKLLDTKAEPSAEATPAEVAKNDSPYVISSSEAKP